MSLIILTRIVLSVSASAVQKRLVIDGAGTRIMWIATYGLMLVPSILMALMHSGPPPAMFWFNVALGGFLDAIGNLAMVAALRATDLSIFGPLNALRPILALIAGWLLLGETPTPIGIVGILVTVSGAILLFSRSESGQNQEAGWSRVGGIIGLRVLGLGLSTIGAVFLKRAAGYGSAELTLSGWITCGLICVTVTAFKQRKQILASFRPALARHGHLFALHAIIFLTMQWCTIRIFQETLLAYSFVFFQLGMVLQVIVGRIFFSEPAFGKRLIASFIMALGSTLILWKG